MSLKTLGTKEGEIVIPDISEKCFSLKQFELVSSLVQEHMLIAKFDESFFLTSLLFYYILFRLFYKLFSNKEEEVEVSTVTHTITLALCNPKQEI